MQPNVIREFGAFAVSYVALIAVALAALTGIAVMVARVL